MLGRSQFHPALLCICTWAVSGKTLVLKSRRVSRAGITYVELGVGYCLLSHFAGFHCIHSDFIGWSLDIPISINIHLL